MRAPSVQRDDVGSPASATSTLVVQARRRWKSARTAPHDASCSLRATAHPCCPPPPDPLPVTGGGGRLPGDAARAVDRAGVGAAAAAAAGAVRDEQGEDGGAAVPDAAEARHCALRHRLLLLGEGVAAEVDLPARVAVHHPRAAVVPPLAAAAPRAAAAVVVVVVRHGGLSGGGRPPPRRRGAAPWPPT